MKIKIGVMGSASGTLLDQARVREQAAALGRAIARAGCALINGACPGLPDAAAAAAHAEGGLVIGVSPAFSLEEHVAVYTSPVAHYDIILYTGLGLMERDIIDIRSSDLVLFVGGGMGTLNEFTVAYEERKVIGALEGIGGISDRIDEVLALTGRPWRPESMVKDSDPDALVRRALALYASYRGPALESQSGADKPPGWDHLEALRAALGRKSD
ncbi:MAG: hypothetical protein ABIO70_33915 [Pseudomonadota bacterium]